jgi:FtsH-binding integral membrane protein
MKTLYREGQKENRFCLSIRIRTTRAFSLSANFFSSGARVKMESLPHTVAKMFGPPSNGPAQEQRSSAGRKEHDVEAADGMYGPRSDCFVFEAYPEVKKAFIRRVYQILVGQLLLTATVIYCIRALYNINNAISLFGEEASPEPPPSGGGPSTGALSNLFWAGFLGSMTSLSLLHFVARRHPLNLVVLFAFTFFESLLLSSALIFVPAGLLFQALLTTTVVFVGLILYTLESKTDYSFLHSYLGSALWIIIAAGFFQLFWPMGDTMDTIYTWGGALVFCGFIIYDTWRLHFQVRALLPLRHSFANGLLPAPVLLLLLLILFNQQQLKPDEYVLAAASLYLDFINLFLRILHLLSKKK